MTSPRCTRVRTASTSVVDPAVDHNHRPSTEPSTIVATDTNTPTGRRRSFGGAPAEVGSASGDGSGRVRPLGLVRTDMGLAFVEGVDTGGVRDQRASRS